MMALFTDKQGRPIEIDAESGHDVYAYHNGQQIAHFTILEGDQVDPRMPPGPSQLYSMAMEEAYYKAGIGWAMLIAGFEQHGILAPPSAKLADKNRMTDKGWAFVQKGIAANYIYPLDDEPY
jgi:hypothetical protein